MNITATQYALAKNMSRQGVTKRIRAKKALPGVSRISKVGKTYVLQVKKDFFLQK